jgi:hypothetical protein
MTSRSVKKLPAGFTRWKKVRDIQERAEWSASGLIAHAGHKGDAFADELFMKYGGAAQNLMCLNQQRNRGH